MISNHYNQKQKKWQRICINQKPRNVILMKICIV